MPPLNPYRFVPEHLCKAALEFVNEQIVKHGGTPQTVLAAGFPLESNACPLSNTLRKGISAKLTQPETNMVSTSPTRIRFNLLADEQGNKYTEVEVALPMLVVQFVDYFDCCVPAR